MLSSPQLLDLPGIIEGAKDGKGRGRQVIAGESIRPVCIMTSGNGLGWQNTPRVTGV